jgi:phospholipid/cholesterol/gamma-HCH transport system substrate-binding protein
METSARHFIVGIGVLALIGVAVLSSLWYFRGDEEDDLRSFVIYFKKQSVSGLQVGSVITMRGIRIGEVEEISILSQESEGARVHIKVQENAPVSGQTRAVIERNLLTGLSWIELSAVQITQNREPLLPTRMRNCRSFWKAKVRCRRSKSRFQKPLRI